jgi:hypothetical protein
MTAVLREAHWDFGTIAPGAFSRAEALVNEAPSLHMNVTVQFVQLQAQSIEAFVSDDFIPVARLRIDGQNYLSSEEAVRREYRFEIPAGARDIQRYPIAIAGGIETDTIFDATHHVRGRVVHERWPLHGEVKIEEVHNSGVLRVRITLENQSDVREGADRAVAMRTSFMSTQLLFEETA